MAKLDSVSKIIIATSAINYMANNIYGVNQTMKAVVHATPENSAVFEEGIKEKDAILEETVKKLGIIMEDLGNLINNCDAISPIDERVTKPAFDIIVHGKDDVNK